MVEETSFGPSLPSDSFFVEQSLVVTSEGRPMFSLATGVMEKGYLCSKEGDESLAVGLSSGGVPSNISMEKDPSCACRVCSMQRCA